MTPINTSEEKIKPHSAKGGFQHENSDFEQVCALLLKGGIAAIPTETVYGLAADSSREDAVAQIYAAKGRPNFNPLIVHVASIERAKTLVYWNERADKLAQKFWPGPLTMVLESRPENNIAANVSAGLSTLAVRMPAHPVMRDILESTGLNLAAPSANRSGQLSPTTAKHVTRSFAPHSPYILDRGQCSNGIESTIVAVRPDGWRVLRPGTITEVDIVDILEEKPLKQDARQTIQAPGQLDSHYAPKKQLRLNVQDVEADEFYIGFGDMKCDESLSLNGDLYEAAANLFAALHRADQTEKKSIAVALIPMEGVGKAINDRLKRAAVLD